MAVSSNIWYIIAGMIGFGVLGLLAAIIYYSVTKNKYKNNSKLNQRDQIVVKSKFGFKEIFDRIYQISYLILVKIPIIKYYTKKTRLKLEMVNDYTEYEIRKRTGSIMLMSLIFIFSALFIFLNAVTNLYMALVVILLVFIINDVLVNSRINKIADNMLRQIPEVFTEIRHSFHEHGMIDESFNDAIDELEDKEIMPQVKRIREALASENPEVQLEKYYDTAPSKFLKLFAGISYLTMELGDRKVNGVSVYLKNLNNILNDVYLEILKRDKLNYMFKSLTVIAIIPILFIQAVENWATFNFPSLTNFYSSSIGFIIQAILVVSIFLSYFSLKVIKEDSNEIKFDRIASVRWQDKVYKWPIVRFMVDGFMPIPNTRKYKRLADRIKTSNSYLTMPWLYVNKITYAILTFLIMFTLVINIHYIDLQSVYNDISQEFLGLGQLSDKDKEAAESMNETDKKIVENLKKEKAITEEDVRYEIKNQMGREPTDVEVERILEKLNKIKNNYVKFWEVLIAICVAWIAYFVPNLILIIKNKIRELEREDEVMQFQSIILMLMYIERVDVQTILEWLERYAYAYKEPIATALNNYEAGAVEALEDLKDAVPQKDFRRIVEALISSVERIPIKDAFDELETERVFQFEKRKETNERIIQRRSMLGKAVGFTPLVILVAGYFVGPLLLVSIMQLMTYISTMTY